MVTETLPHPTTLDVSAIRTDGNIRSDMDPEKLKELAANIGQVGIIQPLIVRPDADGGYILVAGARRLAACKLAGLKDVPVRVAENVKAEDAALIQTFENLHRENLGPIDEAMAFKAILESGKLDYKGLAQSVSKSEKYVVRSVRLLELPVKVLDWIAQGVWTPAHGHQLLRAPAAAREAILKRVGNSRIDPDNLGDLIEREIGRNLENARFPVATAYPGVATTEKAADLACTACPFNSGNQGLLFASSAKGHCTFAPCFDAKTAHALDQVHAAQAKKHPGLKDLGIREVGWDGRVAGDKSGGVVLRGDALSPTVKKAMKDHPEKFGFVVKKPDSWERGPVQAGIVCFDKKLLPKKASYDPSTGRPRQTAKEKAVQKAVYAALWKATSELRLGAAQLRVAIPRCGATSLVISKVSGALGVDVTSKAELAKLNEGRLGGVLLALVCSGYNEPLPTAMSEAGIDAATIKRDAAKAAAAAYDAQKKGKAHATPDAKGGQPAGGAAKGRTPAHAQRRGKGDRAGTQSGGAASPLGDDNSAPEGTYDVD